MRDYAKIVDSAIRSLNRQGWTFRPGVKSRAAEIAAKTAQGHATRGEFFAKEAMVRTFKAEAVKSPYFGFHANG